MKYLLISLSFVFLVACSTKKEISFAEKQLNFAASQLNPLRLKAINQKDIPRSTNPDGSIHWITSSGEWQNNLKTGLPFEWTEGFFPGTCWNMYEFTKDEKWKETAQELMKIYRNQTKKQGTHDLGFVFQTSYGKGYKLTDDKDYKEAVIEASNALIKRFYPTVGCIKSWDGNKDWQKPRGWTCPVIIDNMLNLEMLFETTMLTGDSSYAKIAISHANTTLKNHFRTDYSSYHVIDYDTITGKVRSKETAQGFSNESAWARGQAWGLYGFTMCYRYTKDAKYLAKAEQIASFLLSNKNLPKDKVPYWDFNCPNIPNTYRDASAAAIIASALVELDEYAPKNDYLLSAQKIINSLSSKQYLAKLNQNNNFLLKHNVGSIPHQLEIDVPINYADYYYVEALMRLKKHNTTEVAQNK